MRDPGRSRRYAAAVPDRGVTAPSPAMLFMELRCAPEFAAFMGAWPFLSMAPRGDGHTVLVLPPFGVNDRYTQPLRSLLGQLGYDAQGWELGHNLGLTHEIVVGVPERLLELHERAGDPVSIVGWSMGGMLARALAREHPTAVRQVICLGAPFRLTPGDASSTNAAMLYEMVRHLQVDPTPSMLAEHDRVPLPVPSTSIYSRSDGVVNWEECVDDVGPRSENIEIHGSHCGLGHNPAAVIAVLDRLAQPKGEWRPFVPPFGMQYLYLGAATAA
jgi:pimeloyl-ACP methyl ester carboxylesterase